MTSTRHDTVLLDVDGTLIDSTYHHAIAWHRAFRDHGIDLPMWRIHRVIGMGGDRLVAAVAGDAVEERHGDALREAHGEKYAEIAEDVGPLPGARELVRFLGERFIVALGSSGSPEHTALAQEKVGLGEDDVAAATSSGDADSSKPSPDILRAALEQAGGTSAIVVGDAPYDIVAAARMGAPCIAVRTGGFGPAELEAAGAVLVVDGLPELLDVDWDALARATPPPGAENDPPVL